MEIFKTLAKDGNPIIGVRFNQREFFLSSKYYPVSEAERLAKNIENRNPRKLIVGIGNPYLLYYLSKENREIEILAIEPNETIFQIINTDKTFKRLIDNIKVLFIRNIDELKELLSEMSYFDYYIHPQYKVLFEFIESWEQLIKSTIHNLDINKNTLKRFGNIWVKNLILSLDKVLITRGVKEIFELFNGIDITVVGAGPSLDSNIDILKKLWGSTLIISVDTSWQYLKSKNITPDIVVSVDPQIKNLIYLLLNKEYSDTLFVFDTLYPSMIYHFIPLSNIFTFNSPLKLWKFIEKNWRVDKGDIMVGGSVICSAIDLANKLGARRIILIGADFSFPKGKLYAKGNYYEISNFVSSNILNSYDQWNILSKYPLLERISTNNKKILTDPRMITFKEWIENYIRTNNVEIINLSTEGLNIEGSKLNLENLQDNVRSKISQIKHLLFTNKLHSTRENLVKNLKMTLENIINTFTNHGVYGITKLLEEDEFSKYLFEMGMQRILLDNYSEKEFLDGIKHQVKYIKRLHNFI